MEIQEINSLSDAELNGLIGRIPYFKELKLNDYGQYNLLLEHSKLMSLEPGEVFLQKGQLGSEIYFLAQGHLDVFPGESPGEKALNHLTTGEIIAALSIINAQPRTATLAASAVFASDNTKVIATDFSIFGELDDFTNVSLQTKVNLLRLVINNIRFKISTYQSKNPDHRLVKESADIQRFNGESNTIEELESLAEQAYALTELLGRWNDETEASIEVPKIEVKLSTKEKILGFFSKKN